MMDATLAKMMAGRVQNPPLGEAQFLERMAIAMFVLLPVGELCLLGCLFWR